MSKNEFRVLHLAAVKKLKGLSQVLSALIQKVFNMSEHAT